MDDDLNTPMVLAHLFDAIKIINSVVDDTTKLDADQIATLKHLFNLFLIELLGVRIEGDGSQSQAKPLQKAVDLLMEIRANAKANKDWATSDLIRDKLASYGFEIKDTKNGVEWSLK